LAQAHLDASKAGEDWETRSRQLITCARMVLRYAALVVAADYARQDFKDEQLSFRLERLKYPLDSDFPNLIEAGVPALVHHGSQFVAELGASAEALTSEIVVIQRMGEKGFEPSQVTLRKGILDLRNAITHDHYVGRWQEFWTNHAPLVERLLAAFSWLGDYPLLRPVDEDHWARMSGPGPDFPVERIPDAAREAFQAEVARAGTSGLVLADPRCERFMSLFPFLLWDDCPYCLDDSATPLSNEAFMFNGENGRRLAAYVGPHHSRPFSGLPRQTASAIFESKQVPPKPIRVKDLKYGDLLSRSSHQTMLWLGEARASLKYVDALYQARTEAEALLKRFLAGGKSGFLILGEAGMGKSNLLAHFVIDLHERGVPVLTYPAYYLDAEEAFESYIIKDLQVDGSLEELMQRLVTTGSSLVVAVDGLNENQQDVARLLRKLCHFVTRSERVARTAGDRDLVPPIKVVMTMRTTSFERALGEILPEGEDEAVLFPVEAFEVPLGPNGELASKPRYVLDRMTGVELANAYETYRRYEGYTDANGRRVRFAAATPYSELAPAVREVLAHPWLLRVALEAYDGKAMPADVWAGDLLRAYCDARIFGRTETERGAFAGRAEVVVDLVGLMRAQRRDTFALDDLAALAPALHMRIEAAGPATPYVRLLEEGVLMEVEERRAFGLRTVTKNSVRFASDRLLEYLLAESLMRPWAEVTPADMVALVDEGQGFRAVAGAVDVLILEALARDRAALVAEALACIPDDGVAVAHGANLLSSLGSLRHCGLDDLVSMLASTLPPARALAMARAAGDRLAEKYLMEEAIICFGAARVVGERVAALELGLERAEALEAAARACAMIGRHEAAAAVQEEVIRALKPAWYARESMTELALAWIDACLKAATYFASCRRFVDAQKSCRHIRNNLVHGVIALGRHDLQKRVLACYVRDAQLSLRAGQAPSIAPVAPGTVEAVARAMIAETGDEGAIELLAEQIACDAAVWAVQLRSLDAFNRQAEVVELWRGLQSTHEKRGAIGLAGALVTLGDYCVERPEPQEASSYYCEAVDLLRPFVSLYGVEVFGPPLARALAGLGRALGRLGHFLEARLAFDESLHILARATKGGRQDLEPTRAEAYLLYARTLTDACDYERAMFYFREGAAVLSHEISLGVGCHAFPLLHSQPSLFVAAVKTGRWAHAADAFKVVVSLALLCTDLAPLVEAELRQRFFQLQDDARSNIIDALGWDAYLVDPRARFLLKAYYLAVGSRRITGDPALLDHARDRASRGYPAAMTDLAVALWEGELVPRDTEKAVALTRAAVEAGAPLAAFNLAQMLGARGHAEEAVNWYRIAAESGDADAQYAYGVALETRSGTEAGVAEALKWYKRAARNGVPDAAYRYGQCLINGGDGARSFYAGIRWLDHASERGHASATERLLAHLPRLKRDADRGDAQALLVMAGLYRRGIGVKTDHRKTVDFIRRAVKKGSGEACLELAFIYHDQGSPKEFFRHLAKSAELGCELAYFNLAMCYEDGVGTSRMPDKAIEWYVKAAEADESDAFQCLANLCGQGWGLEADAAVDWLRKGAMNGGAKSQQDLAKRCITGIGLGVDLRDAFAWASRAYANKLEETAFFIGLIYLHGENHYRAKAGLRPRTGESFSVDRDEAKIWISLASRSGNVEARTLLASIRDI
jgi:hypothetical protein